MRPWLKRAGYLLILLLWLVIIGFPIAAFLLATQDQIQIGSHDNGIRLFLLQETNNQGLGLQWTRPYDDSASAAQSQNSCTQTTLRYFLWAGDSQNQNADYCQCFDSQTDQPLPLGACSLP
jgi:hypothetical protein